MNAREQVASGLATAMLAGPWSRVGLRARCRGALGRGTSPRWLMLLVDDVLVAYRVAPADRPRELAAYLQTRSAWAMAWQHRRPPRIVAWTPTPTELVARRWPVAELNDLADLTRLLDVDQGELAWFADVRTMNRRAGEPLQHYCWTALARPSGVRLIALPKPRLKQIQRRVLRSVLDPIALHDAAHGGVRGRSVRTAVAPHVGADVLIRVDLEAFFDSIPAGRIWNLLRFAGLPEPVAHTITGLATTQVPVAVLSRYRAQLAPGARSRLQRAHLPIGAPTSPALANLLAYSLDRRLSGLAATFGAHYTRYVDDLIFSGGPSLRARHRRFLELVGQIVRAEGFAVNQAKTTVVASAGRQSVLGAVVNERPTLPRAERDELRAILHNARVHGWRSQAGGQEDFARHLRGRIAWAASIDPVLGGKLLDAYQAVDWA